MAYLIVLISFFAAFFFSVLFSSGIKALEPIVNIPGFILVIIPAVTIALVSNTLKGVNPLTVLFGNRQNVNKKKAVNAYRFFRTFGNACVAMGFIAFFISSILLLRGLPNPRAIGPAFSIGLCSLMYAAFLKVSAYAAEQHVLHKADIRDEIVKSDFKGWGVYLYALLAMVYR